MHFGFAVSNCSANHTAVSYTHLDVYKRQGIDRVIEVVIDRMGKVDKLYLTGDYAKGKDSGIIDLVLVGDIDKEYVVKMVAKAEKLIDRKVRFLTYETEEWNK